MRHDIEVDHVATRCAPRPASRLPLLVALALCAAPAMAQPVSGDGIGEFVGSHSSVTRLGKIARWEDGVCPNVTGLPANFAKFITKRVRDVATAAGAPVDASETCKANVDIVFTTKPQALLDTIRAKDPVMLGYYDSSEQADRLAKVNYVIQAWHATQTVDLRGNTVIDSRNATNSGSAMGSRARACMDWRSFSTSTSIIMRAGSSLPM